MATDPPIVPRFLTCLSPIPSASFANAGIAFFTKADSATLTCLAIAPIFNVSPSSAIESSLHPEISTSPSGLASLCFSVGIRVIPPAKNLPSPKDFIASKASVVLFGLTYFVEYEEFKNLYFPFFKNLIINLGWFFIPFSIFVIVGSSNAVNLTDGLDGLATVPVILVAGCFAFISYITGNIVFSEYLQILYIEGAGEISIFCGSIIGACLGFLWFNAPPAKIFMGDTGSLSLGGSLGAISIITKHEIVLAITGGLFVLEALSVLIQVISFKLTGRRIFKMAPIHHHFEKKGWPESTVVIRFWIISIILAVIGLATLKLR